MHRDFIDFTKQLLGDARFRKILLNINRLTSDELLSNDKLGAIYLGMWLKNVLVQNLGPDRGSNHRSPGQPSDILTIRLQPHCISTANNHFCISNNLHFRRRAFEITN